MGIKSNKFTQKLKFYHIALISMILCPFLILNSNSINKKREEVKLEEEKNIFMRKLYARKLGEDDKFIEDTNKVCEKASKDVRDYYSGKGDLNSLGVDDSNVERKDKNKYIDGLINVVSGEGEGDLMDYVMHLIPILSLIGISLLFLPGWLVCCICSCADCCRCSCCKRDNCRMPFFIITSVFYGVGIAVSIYGLSQSAAVFEGLGDTECSLLKFINDVLNGETKTTTPKWGGITNIQNILRNTEARIRALDSNTQDQLSNGRSTSTSTKENFEIALEKLSSNIYSGSSYDKNIDSKTYVLDIVNQFGSFTRGSPPTITSNFFVSGWYEEYRSFSENIGDEIANSISKFDNLINNDDKTTQLQALTDAANEVDKIKNSFNKVKNKISKVIIDYSDKIDKYGNIGYKTVFSLLLVIDSLIVSLISIKMFFKNPSIQNGCFKCLLSSGITALWNLLAFFTFLTLLLGSVLSLVGTAGNDLVSVVSFFVGDENLNRNQDDVIFLGEAATYLKKCINEDGDLKGELNLNTAFLDNLEKLKEAENKINDLIKESEQLKNAKISYTNYKKTFDKMKSFQTLDFYLIKKYDTSDTLKLSDYISSFNNDIGNSKNERWSNSCSNNIYRCTENEIIASHSNFYCMDIATCSKANIDSSYVYDTPNDNVVKLKAFFDSIKTASVQTVGIENTESNSITDDINSIEDALAILNKKYELFLEGQTRGLGIIKGQITGLTDIFTTFVGEKGPFEIINCKFIGNNVKIILKSLENSLGNKIYSVGISMTIAGYSMCLSISFTILLNFILNNKDNGSPMEDLKAMNKNVDIANQFDTPNNNVLNTAGGYSNDGVRIISYNKN